MTDNRTIFAFLLERKNGYGEQDFKRTNIHEIDNENRKQ